MNRSVLTISLVIFAFLLLATSLGLVTLEAKAHRVQARQEVKPQTPATVNGGMYIAVGYGGRRMSSADGITWSNDTEWEANGGDDNFCLFSVAFGAGRFVMVGEHGYRGVSTDGKQWETTSDPAEDFHWVFWTGKQFVLGGNKTFLSPDSLHWSRAAKDVYCEPQCATPGHFLGVSWKTNLWHSEDALTWQRVSATGTNAFTSIAYGHPSPATR